ncbi:MAG: mannonate dehydratase [Kiritimatiellae bacterium]|nr:mannonate dehydratase [Kiritimatiellia bacterium]
MTLVEFVPPTPHPLWKLCPQMGITDVVVKVNPDLTGLPDPWRYETLSKIVGRLKDAGLNVVGLEGDPFDMSPIKEYGARVGENSSSWRKEEQNPPSNSNSNLQLVREETLEHYRELLESMGKLGIKLLCYNFMVGKGWSRTGVREVRGGAKVTYFSLRVGENSSSWRKEEQIPPSNSNSKLQLNAEQVWSNYEFFIKAVMPTAERCGVRMALHPDDPCLPSLGGYARIFGSVESYDRAYALYPSPSNAITFCQANFKLMLGGSGSSEFEFESGCKTPFSNSNSKLQLDTLVDVARHFGKRIAFIHVRDVEGTKEDFTELFHDQGDTDQFTLMRTYRELGLDVPLRGDHVPEMAYDRELTPEGTPGYFTLGRLFANGYLTALLQGTLQ